MNDLCYIWKEIFFQFWELDFFPNFLLSKFPTIMEKSIDVWNKLIGFEEWVESKIYIRSFLSRQPKVHSIVSALPIPYKYTGAFALIPEGWDYEYHLRVFPLTDYLFVEMPNGKVKAINRQGVPQSYFDIDRLMYIIGLISSIPAKNKDSITENGFVMINSKLLRNFFKDYISYLDYLIKTGVLITDGEYIPGEKSLGFKFSSSFSNTGLNKYFYNNTSINTIPAINEVIYNDETNEFTHNTALDYPYLSHWYETKHLLIDDVEATQFALYERQRKLSLGREHWDINRDKTRDYRIVYKNPITQYNAAIHNITQLSIKSYNVIIDDNVHRLHSVLTNLQKTYRKYLKYNGEELVGVDISNCQPYLLCILLNPNFWIIDSDASLKLSHLPDNIRNLFSDKKIETILNRLNNLEESDIREYTEKASQGLVYEYMMETINAINQTRLSRDDVKTMMMTVLFSDNRHLPPLKRLFIRTFPAIYDVVKLIQRGSKKTLACLLQNIESEIILHRCCKRLWLEHDHKIPTFTIHDSICTIPEYVDTVRRVMYEELNKSVGIPPSLKEERW